MHSRIHADAQEAEFGAAESGARAADQFDRSDDVHPGHRAQPAGALDRAGARRGRGGRARAGAPPRARRVSEGAREQMAQKANAEPLGLFKKAIENVKPTLEVKSRRVGGANYQVPVEVNPFRRQSLAIRWR